jgi:hypothetical protein
VAWLEFDFEAPPEPPRYLVDGLFERGTVNIISSDTGAGKTWLSCALIAASLGETDWLARRVDARRVIAIDEENPAGVIRARLRALGVTNQQVERLHYASRQGASLGEAEWNGWLLDQAIEHDADLILVDTVMAATSIDDVNDNTQAVAIYKGLRAIAEEADLAVVLFHHHRKSQTGQQRGGGQAMMGGRQWAGQADAHLTLRKVDQLATSEKAGEHHFNIEISIEKLRNGIETPPELIRVEICCEEDCLLTAAIENLGLAEREPSKAEALALSMYDALRDGGPCKVGKLAEALDVPKGSGTWERARQIALKRGWISQVGEGVGIYEAGAEEPAR